MTDRTVTPAERDDLGSAGFVVRCGDDGTIEEVLRRDPTLRPGPQVGASLLAVIDTPSRAKAERLLHTARIRGFAYDWEIVVDAGAEPRVFNVSAFLRSGRVLVVGAGSSDRMAELCRETEGVDLTLVRRREAPLRPVKPSDERARLDGLMALNNELTALCRAQQRDLADLRPYEEACDRLVGDVVPAIADLQRRFDAFGRDADGAGRSGETVRAGGAPSVEGICAFGACQLRLINRMIDTLRPDRPGSAGVQSLARARRPEGLAAMVAAAEARNQDWWGAGWAKVTVTVSEPDRPIALARGLVVDAIAVLFAERRLAVCGPLVLDCRVEATAAPATGDAGWVELAIRADGSGVDRIRGSRLVEAVLAQHDVVIAERPVTAAAATLVMSFPG